MNLNQHFVDMLDEGIKNAPKDKRFITVNVSSCHMSIFYTYYDSLHEISASKGYEILDPQCYSRIVLVWDIEGNELVFYDNIGMVSEAHSEWEKQKDLPKTINTEAPPIIVKSIFEREDHYCQADPGKNTCYFCGESMKRNN